LLATEPFSEAGESTTFLSGWKEYHADLLRRVEIAEAKKLDPAKQTKKPSLQEIRDVEDYLSELEEQLVFKEAKSWDELYPTLPAPGGVHILAQINGDSSSASDSDNSRYVFLHKYTWQRQSVGQHLVLLYDQLFEACFDGDNEKIRQLCLPAATSRSPIRALHVMVEMANRKDRSVCTGK